MHTDHSVRGEDKSLQKDFASDLHCAPNQSTTRYSDSFYTILFTWNFHLL